MNVTTRERTLTRLAIIWAYPLWLAVQASGAARTVRRDTDRWVECVEVQSIAELTLYARFARIAGSLPEFRSLVHYRIQALPLPARFILRKIYPGLGSLYIQTPSIGPGLFIQHGVATIINAAVIGDDCWINQNVTVGFNTKGAPIIGNNVRIAAGANVVGPITVGDGATIGLNATVFKDVPANAVMVAPPATRLEQPE